jgi:hypothetical protein
MQRGPFLMEGWGPPTTLATDVRQLFFALVSVSAETDRACAGVTNPTAASTKTVVGRSQALLPVATFSVIEPMPRSAAGWQQLLSDLASRYARVTLENRSRILSQP